MILNAIFAHTPNTHTIAQQFSSIYHRNCSYEDVSNFGLFYNFQAVVTDIFDDGVMVAFENE